MYNFYLFFNDVSVTEGNTTFSFWPKERQQGKKESKEVRKRVKERKEKRKEKKE